MICHKHSEWYVIINRVWQAVFRRWLSSCCLYSVNWWCGVTSNDVDQWCVTGGVSSVSVWHSATRHWLRADRTWDHSGVVTLSVTVTVWQCDSVSDSMSVTVYSDNVAVLTGGVSSVSVWHSATRHWLRADRTWDHSGVVTLSVSSWISLWEDW